PEDTLEELVITWTLQAIFAPVNILVYIIEGGLKTLLVKAKEFIGLAPNQISARLLHKDLVQGTAPDRVQAVFSVVAMFLGGRLLYTLLKSHIDFSNLLSWVLGLGFLGIIVAVIANGPDTKQTKDKGQFNKDVYLKFIDQIPKLEKGESRTRPKVLKNGIEKAHNKNILNAIWRGFEKANKLSDKPLTQEEKELVLAKLSSQGKINKIEDIASEQGKGAFIGAVNNVMSSFIGYIELESDENVESLKENIESLKDDSYTLALLCRAYRQYGSSETIPTADIGNKIVTAIALFLTGKLLYTFFKSSAVLKDIQGAEVLRAGFGLDKSGLILGAIIVLGFLAVAVWRNVRSVVTKMLGRKKSIEKLPQTEFVEKLKGWNSISIETKGAIAKATEKLVSDIPEIHKKLKRMGASSKVLDKISSYGHLFFSDSVIFNFAFLAQLRKEGASEEVLSEEAMLMAYRGYMRAVFNVIFEKKRMPDVPDVISKGCADYYALILSGLDVDGRVLSELMRKIAVVRDIVGEVLFDGLILKGDIDAVRKEFDANVEEKDAFDKFLMSENPGNSQNLFLVTLASNGTITSFVKHKYIPTKAIKKKLEEDPDYFNISMKHIGQFFEYKRKKDPNLLTRLKQQLGFKKDEKIEDIVKDIFVTKKKFIAVPWANGKGFSLYGLQICETSNGKKKYGSIFCIKVGADFKNPKIHKDNKGILSIKLMSCESAFLTEVISNIVGCDDPRVSINYGLSTHISNCLKNEKQLQKVFVSHSNIYVISYDGHSAKPIRIIQERWQKDDRRCLIKGRAATKSLKDLRHNDGVWKVELSSDKNFTFRLIRQGVKREIVYVPSFVQARQGALSFNIAVVNSIKVMTSAQAKNKLEEIQKPISSSLTFKNARRLALGGIAVILVLSSFYAGLIALTLSFF
ncbi:MAG: hypothetical protein KJ706_00885, partial [Candidatus Omnitrophica bacterium]|nr:hypothetical protein [Candidatus Omnitrophota bacterium]